MNLRDYLHFNELTINEFARSIKYDPTYISAVACYSKKAGRKLMEAIVERTQGIISKDDMRQSNIKVQERIQKVIVEKQAKEQACAEIN